MSTEWQKQKAVRRDQSIGGPGHGPGVHFGMAKPKNAFKTLMRLFATLAGSLPLLIAAMVLTILSAFSGVAGTWYLKPLINGLTQGVGPAGLLGPLGMMTIVFLVGALCTYLSSLMMVTIAQRTTNRIRTALFNHLQKLPLRYFDSNTQGELMSRFTNDVDNVNMALEQSLSSTITSLISVVGTFIMMLILSPFLTIFVVLMLVVMGWAMKFVGGKSAQYFRDQQKSLGALNGYIEEMMEGQKVVKVFNYEQTAHQEFRKRNEALRLASTDAQTYAGVLMPIMGNLSYINYAITAMVGAILTISGKMDIGTIAAFLQYTRTFSQPITQVAAQINMLLAALAGAERIFDVMDQTPEVDDGKVKLVLATHNADGVLVPCEGDPTADFQHSFHAADDSVEPSRGVLAWRVEAKDGSISLRECRGEVQCEQVDFGYLPETPVLKNLTVLAKPGQKIAFVGSTGAGKTTITNLINRFYEIEGGSITYDGIDIRQICKADLRRTLGMVLQDVHLFQGSIRENIRYGKANATDEQIVEAAKVANAHGFISRLPDGYDTVLSADGINLSQGQRQLLSIARAAVADPPVLILDEATSSIDTRTERLIERGMGQLMHGRTTFVIAHRLSTVRNADAIMVLENGEIIERGNHADLLLQKGRYYELCTGIAELA